MIDLPKFVQLQTTTSCCVRCRFCPNSRLKIRKQIMNEKVFNRILSGLNKLQPIQICLFLKSDPLTDPYIFDRADMIASACKNTAIEISTYGECLSLKKRSDLLSCKVTNIKVSFPTIDDKRYKHLVCGGNCEKAKNNILDLIKESKALGRSDLSISVVVIEGLDDEKGFSRTYDFWYNHGVDVQSWKVNNRAGFLDDYGEPHHHKILKGCSRNRHTDYLHILVDGSLALCCQDYSDVVKLPNLCNKSLEEVWNSYEFEIVRRMVNGRAVPLTNFPCLSCEWAIAD